MKSGPLTDESLATEGSPVPIRFTAFALGKDPLVRGITILFVVAAIPLLIPILADDWRSIYGHHIIEVVFLVLLLVAIRYRLSSVEEPNERRFWNLITFGFAWWILATGTGPIAEVLFTDAEMISQIVKNGPYLIFYGAIITALEIHPHVKRDSIGYQLQNLNWVGLFVLLFGLFSYFLVVPSIYRGDTSAFWSSTLALFVAFAGAGNYPGMESGLCMPPGRRNNLGHR